MSESPAATRPTLLIIEDDPDLRQQMEWALCDEYNIIQANDRASALQVLRRGPAELVTLDLGLPPDAKGVQEGFEALSELIEFNRALKVLVITGSDQRENALKAIDMGAYDFFPKPIQLDELKTVLRRALHVHRLESELKDLQTRSPDKVFEGMLGTSPQMRGVFHLIRKVAKTEVPVLIVGESGTGKELAARAIHRRSRRAEGPFVAINCGAIPDTLLESELFGHEKGSFTGAHVTRKGRIEAASGGTLFLDELAELTVPLQVKLLRFLQEQKIERVGGRQSIGVDVRLLTATNSELTKAMAEGRFREDLYYRVRVVEIGMPPLREREGDILHLSRIFLDRYNAEAGKNLTGFNQKAMMALEKHAWPGNVRELENRIRRAVIMAEGSKITPADLELSFDSSPFGGKNLREAREELEREFVQRAITVSQGNLSQAAAELGISRPTLYDLMQKLGIGGADRSESTR